MWDLVPKILTIVLTVGTALYRFRGSVGPRARSGLKADCELLQLGELPEKSRKTLETNIEAQVQRLYGHAPVGWLTRTGLGKATWSYVIGGTAALLAATGLTVYLLRHGFSWWSLLTGYTALMAIAVIRAGFSEQHHLDTQQHHLDTLYTALGKKSFEVAGSRDLDDEETKLIEEIQEHLPSSTPH